MPELLHLAATVALGLFAGALLTEGAILVPYWRKMTPGDFFGLHGALGPVLFRFFAPLTIVAVVLAVVSALVSVWAGDLTAARSIAAGGALATLLIFFAYFRRANQSFADRSIADEALPAELRRWAGWHWIRTAIIIAAFVAAVAAMEG